MTQTKKLSLVVLLVLAALTVGAHTAYRAHARGRPAATSAEAPSPKPLPDVLRAPLASLLPHPADPAIPAPADAPVRVTAQLDRTAVLQGSDGSVHVEVSIQTTSSDATSTRVPSDFIVVADRSGSMQGEKLEYAKQAIRQLIARLGPEDRFALVTYESSAELRVPLTAASAESRSRFLREVRELEVAGGTNMSGGLDLALRQIQRADDSRRATRVLVLSDGMANEGDRTLDGLVARARSSVERRAVLSAIGIGSDFDETVMTSLANAGAGAFYYLAKLEVLPTFLDAELKTAKETYAQGAELRFREAPGVRVTSVSGLPVRRDQGLVVVPIGSLYAQHERKLWLTLRLTTEQLREHDLGQLSVTYHRDGKTLEQRAPELPRVACISDPATFRARIAQPVWERAILEEEMGRTDGKLGEAIKSGDAADVDHAVAATAATKKLAEQLGNAAVLRRVEQLEGEAREAKAAQRASAPARSHAAKAKAARSFSTRQGSVYKNANPAMGY